MIGDLPAEWHAPMEELGQHFVGCESYHIACAHRRLMYAFHDLIVAFTRAFWPGL